MPATEQQQQRIKCLTAKFDRDWTVNVGYKLICRREVPWWKWPADKLVGRKHPVFALYWWCKRTWPRFDLMGTGYPIRADQMPVPGQPTKYEMQGGWQIREADIRYLEDGPLMSEGLGRVIVPPAGSRWTAKKVRLAAVGAVGFIGAVFSIAEGWHWIEPAWAFVRELWPF